MVLYQRLVEIKTIPWESVSNSGYVISSLCVAFFGLIRYDSFEEGLIHIVNLGDDADTGGAIFGGIGGAYYGIDALPKRWLDVILRKDEIINLVNTYYS